MQKITIIRFVFIFIFFFLLNLKNIEFLFLSLIILWAVSFKKIFRLNFRVLKSIIIFNLGISIGYFLMSLIKKISPWDYLLYINLKVYVLTYFVFYFFSKISVIQFMAFSKDLAYLTTITLSQIFSYKKTFGDFKFAFKSRVVKLSDKDRKFITRVFEFFLKKALKDAEERSLAMKARGFFEK